jgi:hypothetical protein
LKETKNALLNITENFNNEKAISNKLSLELSQIKKELLYIKEQYNT